jgi:serine protease inhibitor
MKKQSLLLIALLLFLSCFWFDGDQLVQYGVAQFGVSNSGLSKSATAVVPHHVQLSYMDSKSHLSTEILTLSLFNDTYLSSPLQLSVGDYSLEEFIVMDEYDSVIYISPKTGSDKAALVVKPLPFIFSVYKDSTTQVIPEVLQIDSADTPEAFGYTEFSFIVVGDYNGFARCMNRFGIDMFKYLAGNSTDSAANTFMSPISISYALALLYCGSDGPTETLLKDLMYFDAYTDTEIKCLYKGFAYYLYAQSPEVEFSLAQAIWHQTGISLLESYVDAMNFYFDSEVSDLNFAGDPAGAADTINEWAYDNTNGRIEEIVKEENLLATVIALANATYFKGPFKEAFDSTFTYPYPFTVSDGTEIQCDMMNSGIEITVPRYHDDAVEMITMPFADDGNYAMTLIMPSNDIDEFVADFTIDDWENWLDNRNNTGIIVSFPKLMIEGNYDLKNTITHLGAGEIFASVDVSRMTSDIDGLFVGNFLHNTFLKVNEGGAEAAAVTVITLDCGIHDSIIFNKPFLLVIHDEETKAILFMGRIDKAEQIAD